MAIKEIKKMEHLPIVIFMIVLYVFIFFCYWFRKSS
jgi:hypothetical protein